jgi:hypothetical protein
MEHSDQIMLGLDKITCDACNLTNKYQLNDIQFIIKPFFDTIYITSLEVLCKNKCHHYINITSIISDRNQTAIKSILDIDHIKLSCPKCLHIIRATEGELYEETTLFFFIDQYVKYYCTCCRGFFYIDNSSYPIITNFIKSKMVDHRLKKNL